MSSAAVQTGTIETNVPARLDRLPWSKFHWLVIFGLGTVWILDGYEVTVVGNIGGRLTEHGSGIAMNASQIGTAGAIYVIGACLGALFFGQLTDRFGRKKLFMITLGVYIVGTAATAFSFAPWYFFLCRFFTGAGIGGEYAAINSAIDELIPARMRGRVDLTINGSFWVGSVLASALAILFLDKTIFAIDRGWRYEFGVGVVLAFGIMIVRRHVPESPRWLFIHGREEEAERIVSGIESDIEEQTGQELAAVHKTITVRQRRTIPLQEIVKVGFGVYPKRAILGFALFVGQAFIYNGITFNLGTLFTTFYKVSSGFVPVFIIIYGVGNFLGPLLLGRLFDTVGRKPMIAGTYLGSALLTVPMAILFASHTISKWEFEAFVFVVFFLASAGASAAYLTVSEIFPMETRALAIAFFYAIGTAVGGISGPLLFGHLINSGVRGQVEIAFFIGAAVMALGGITEVVFGVRAERAQLEDIAKPLTVDEAQRGAPAGAATGDGRTVAEGQDTGSEHRAALQCRSQAEESRARAAEHRAVIHELRAREAEGDDRAGERASVEEALAAVADLEASALDERAAAHEERGDAEEAQGAEREAALQRARAAHERAEGYDEQARALSADSEAEETRHQELAAAAGERARAREHRALAEQARGEAEAMGEGAEEQLAVVRAQMHESWAGMHDARGRVHLARAEQDEPGAEEQSRAAEEAKEHALAAEQRVEAAEHRVAAVEVTEEREAAEDRERRRQEAAERDRRAKENEHRIRLRMETRWERERTGLRRFRPGPPSTVAPPWMVTQTRSMGDEEGDLDREIDMIARAVDAHGATERRELARLVGARYWGPGRFSDALREAIAEGRVRRLSRTSFAPPENGQ